MLELKLSEDLVLVVLATSVAVIVGFLLFMWKRSSDRSNEVSAVMVLKPVPLKDEDEDEDLDVDSDKDKVTVFFGTQIGTAEGFAKGELLSTIHRVGMVEKTEYAENGTLVRAHVPLRFARLLTPMRQMHVS